MREAVQSAVPASRGKAAVDLFRCLFHRWLRSWLGLPDMVRSRRDVEIRPAAPHPMASRPQHIRPAKSVAGPSMVLSGFAATLPRKDLLVEPLHRGGVEALGPIVKEKQQKVGEERLDQDFE